MRVTVVLWAIFLFICLAIYAGLSNAQEKKKVPCEYQLGELTVQAKNLDDDRDVKERRIASLEMQRYMDQQTIKAMQAQMDELKKQLEPEKKAE